MLKAQFPVPLGGRLTGEATATLKLDGVTAVTAKFIGPMPTNAPELNPILI
jgi:hypothetical protein